jgi:hypothetical protein
LRTSNVLCPIVAPAVDLVDDGRSQLRHVRFSLTDLPQRSQGRRRVPLQYNWQRTWLQRHEDGGGTVIFGVAWYDEQFRNSPQH